ncbi:MAG: DUF4149 domain-containing protein [Campylobacteraceae bacterium]|jgi:hypothetical protein|nr:DUF4149 domain-containing protein [Campylobacteraceae bacterium]
MKTAWQKSFFTVYMLVLGICIGSEIAVGMLAAPVIFFPSAYLGDGVLSHFQSGILMTQIFVKFNVMLMFCTLLIVAYEIYLYKIKSYDFVSSVIFFIILLASLAFVLYFTPYIVEAQKSGAEVTASAEFRSVHGWSEIVMKVILLSQVSLFFRRIWTILK